MLLVSSKSKKLADDTKVLFQSRNQGAFSFKPQTMLLNLPIHPSFNLGIEVLLVSTQKNQALYRMYDVFGSFNLGIEVLLVSRLFFLCWLHSTMICFNLGIEVLLVSSMYPINIITVIKEFQSRNRGAFGFKEKSRRASWIPSSVSISESRCFWFQVRHSVVVSMSSGGSFNLVIEVLLVSSKGVFHDTGEALIFVSIS